MIRPALFAVIGITGAAAAVIGGVLLVGGGPGSAVVPRPATSGSPEAPSPAAPGPAATASPSPTAPPEPLMVISRRVSGDQANMTIGQAPDTVLLTRLDGTVVASATFKPSVRPLITNAATIFPPQVHAAAGAAYYIDGDGVVRRLERSGAVTTVASFPTTAAQHMTAFAVSPDGGTIMATVLTFGRIGPGLPGAITIGPSYNNLEMARAGGATTLLSQTPQNTTRPGQFAVAGWDQAGPLAGSIAMATQNALPEGWGVPLFHLSLDGNSHDQLGGSGCVAEVETSPGQVLCSASAFASAPVQVRTGAGTVTWALPAAVHTWSSVALSPRGQALAADPGAFSGAASAANHVYFQDGTVADIPANFYSAGWWDEQTLVGYSGFDRLMMATIALTDHKPGAVHAYGKSLYAGRIDP